MPNDASSNSNPDTAGPDRESTPPAQNLPPGMILLFVFVFAVTGLAMYIFWF